MLTETHEWAAKQVAGYLGLHERATALLTEGSIIPDREQDFPHHTGKSKEIAQNIKKARRLFLKGDDESLLNLGIALHYIQDGWTTKPRVADKHTKWERDIGNLEPYHTTDGKVFCYRQTIGSNFVFQIFNVDYFTSRNADIWIVDPHTGEKIRDLSYGIKVFHCFVSNWNEFINNVIRRLPLPSKAIDKYLTMAYSASIIALELLSYHKVPSSPREKEVLELLELPKHFSLPFILDLKKLGIGKGGTLESTMYYANSFNSKPKWSTPCTDLFFALIFSVGVACHVLFPIDISPKDWI